jgi:outer membrane protein assembly factor BamB
VHRRAAAGVAAGLACLAATLTACPSTINGHTRRSGPSGPWGDRPVTESPSDPRGDRPATGAATDTAALLALDPRTGEPLRRTELPMTMVSGPVISGNEVLVEGNNACFGPGAKPTPSVMAAVDTATGRLTWRRPLSAVSCQGVYDPIVGGQSAVVSATPSCGVVTRTATTTGVNCPVLTVFDVNSGDPLWRSTASVLFGSGDAFVAVTQDGITDLDAASGSPRWAVRPSYGAIAGSTVNSQLSGETGSAAVGLLLTTLPHGKIATADLEQPAANTVVTGVDLASGDSRWHSAFYHEHLHDPLTADGDVAAVLVHHDLSVLDAWSGRPLWQHTYPGETGVTGAAGVIYVNQVVRRRNSLVAVDARTGTRRWRTNDLGDCVFAAPDNGVVIVKDDTILSSPRLHAIDPDSGQVLWTRTIHFPALVAATDDTVFVTTSPMNSYPSS